MEELMFAIGSFGNDRITLDLRQLITDGSLTTTDADRLRSLALPIHLNRILANVLLIFGAFIVVAGILALQPPLEVGLALAISALVVGGALIVWAGDDWGPLGQTLVLMGTLGVSGWAAMRFSGLAEPWPHLAAPLIAVMTIAAAIASRNRVLAVLAPLALGSAVGAGTEYWHAAYALYIREATVCVVLFASLAIALTWLRPRIVEGLRDSALMAARASFFLANFGFWIGSLWGDYPGQMWLRPQDAPWSVDYAWQQTAFHIPDVAFAAAWAVALALALYFGLRTHRRFVANTAIVFIAIHLYTQFFERFHATPAALVAGGVGLIVLGFGLFRFDRWQRSRAEGGEQSIAVEHIAQDDNTA
jgi:iron complex transport system permease protein